MATAATALRIRRASLHTQSIAFICVLLVLGFAVLYPIALLLINSFVVSRPLEETQYGLAGWHYALNDPGILQSLWNTIAVMVVQQTISFPIAIFIAWLLARTNIPWGRGLEFLFWVAFFLPTLAVVQGWVLLLHPSAGLLNTYLMKLPFIDGPVFNIYSFWGIVFAHLFTNSIAIKVMILTPAFRNMDAALEDASRISGANPLRTLVRVTVPVMTPALIVMLMLAVIRAFQSIEIELVLGLPWGFFVFGSKIFDLTKTEPPLFGPATALAVLVLVATLPLIWYQRWASTRRGYTTISSRYQAQNLRLNRWRWPAFAMILGLALMVTVVPFILLVMGTFMNLYGFFDVPSGVWTTRWWGAVIGDPVFIRSMKNTLLLALGSASGAVVFMSLVAYFIVRGRSRFRAAMDFLTWMPYALPGIIIALAWLWIFLRTPFLQPLHGSIWSLMIVTVLSSLTLGVQILKANLYQMGAEIEEASRIAGAGWAPTFWKIVVPLLMPSILVVWIISFVSAAGSAIVPALLATPASRPLALLQLEHVLSGQNEAASVVGVLVVLMTVGVALVARIFGLRIGLGRVA
ncbi:MAG: ABC transporter permease subunit [Chloroflexi bacterium]|nr:ABC transporter permease subunit [Chloroflexota bacterium]